MEVRSTTRSATLRDLLQRPGLDFLMEAHHGLSARLVEEAGFGAIWASGLALSAQLGVRDSNEASWSQVVDVLEFMADACRIPILLDGDTGYGNFNNLRRLVRKLEQRGVAGVCIEDKLFPKTNSFLRSEQQPLADMEEFCGKIRAGKDSQTDPDFCLVARVEALIAGWGLGEALRRAEAYRQAGADAILIHSKRTRPDEILDFAREWAGRAPLLIVPTTYSGTPTEVFRSAGISAVIWANHMLRASVTAMQDVAARVFEAQSVIPVEDRIASVPEVFRLQGAEELAHAEERYGSRSQETGVVVLAATRGGLGPLTDRRPKAMVPVGGRPILARLVEEVRRQGLRSITIAAGYHAEAVDLPGVNVRLNLQHERTGELASLASARDGFRQDTVVAYGDLLFRSYILRDLLESEAPITVVVDSSRNSGPDGCTCSLADDRSVFRQDVRLARISAEAVHGRWIGLVRFRGPGTTWMEEVLGHLDPTGSMADLLNSLVEAGHPVTVQYVHGHWLDVNSLEDLELAEEFSR